MKADDFKLMRGFGYRRTDRETDIGKCRVVAFANENCWNKCLGCSGKPFVSSHITNKNDQLLFHKSVFFEAIVRPFVSSSLAKLVISGVLNVK